MEIRTESSKLNTQSPSAPKVSDFGDLNSNKDCFYSIPPKIVKTKEEGNSYLQDQNKLTPPPLTSLTSTQFSSELIPYGSDTGY